MTDAALLEPAAVPSPGRAGSPHPLSRVLRQGRPLVCGILNVTPDSFSDGGRFDTLDRAVAHGLTLAAEGADLIDVGTNPTPDGGLVGDVDDGSVTGRAAGLTPVPGGVVPVTAALLLHHTITSARG